MKDNQNSTFLQKVQKGWDVAVILFKGEKLNQQKFLEEYATGRRDFSRCRLVGVTVTSEIIKDIDLTGADLRKAKLPQDCEGASLAKVNLSKQTLLGINLKGANMAEACLEGATLQDTILENANLSKSNCSQANFQRCNLAEVEFYQSNLDGCNLHNAYLEGANLSNAKMQSANLSWAFLRNCNLTKTNIKDCNMIGADLFGANLQDAFHYNTVNLSHARILVKTLISKA